MGEVSTCLPEIEALPAKTQAIGFGLTGLSYRSCAIPDQGLHLTSIVYTVAGTLGVLLGLFFIAIPEAEERIPASLASLMTCIIPISTFLIATLILRWEWPCLSASRKFTSEFPRS